MRVYLLWLVVIFASLYSWKDWFKGLCILIFLMAVFERPDIPKSIAGIPGLNPWNILFLNVALSWFISRKNEIKHPPIDKKIIFLVLWYVALIFIAFIREISDLERFYEYRALTGRVSTTITGLFIDDIINTYKYAAIGFFIFFGVNSRERFNLALISILAMNFLLSLQIIKVMPMGLLTHGDALQEAAKRILDRNIGYFRSDLAVLLGGSAWALFTYRTHVKSGLISTGFLLSSIVTVFSLALTGGRIGMGGWIVTGLTMSFLRWKRLLLYAPILVLLIIALVPPVQERFTQGFTDNPEDSYANSEAIDSTEDAQLASITSGRTIIWPYVIDEIAKAPYFGYGRRAMQRIGLSTFLGEELNEPFPHPHNAYMQLLLDNGFVLSLPVFIFFFLLMKYSVSLFRDSRDTVYIVAGGVGIAYVLTHLVGSIGGQEFYPRSGSVSLWCAIGILLRVYLERQSIDRSSSETSQKTIWGEEKTKSVNTKNKYFT